MASMNKWHAWIAGWDRALEDAGYTEESGDHPLPIYDVCEDGDFGTLAIEKMQYEFFKVGLSPEDAVVEAEDRDAFATKWYDPFIDEFKDELGMGDDDDDLDEADEDIDDDDVPAGHEPPVSNEKPRPAPSVKDIYSKFPKRQ